MSTVTTFQQYLQTAFTNGLLTTDEVVELVLPLFEEVSSFHENGFVGSFDKPNTIFMIERKLDIDERHMHHPGINLQAVQKLLKNEHVEGYTVTERMVVDEDYSQSRSEVTNLQVQSNVTDEITRPVYLLGYQCYEMKVGHHDAQTDIFCLGLILGSVVMGLDLYDIDDLNEFAAYRNQPTGINQRIHPTIAALVTEMTELDRSQRSRDLQDVVQRLKYYRDYDPQRQTDLSKLPGFKNKKPADRKGFILDKLKNRLFDTSRRNRLLYYKPNGRFVNLTISSVPIVLHYQSINPQLLFTWNEEISKQIVGMKDIPLNKYLRFEDHLYLNAQLTGIRQISENDKKEYGFSQLKLAVAFLHWHNLKEDQKERIQSPLLLFPVELERKKSLKEEKFTLKIIENVAIINPVLSNHLKDLYGITLPESIDFDEVNMQQFFELLKSQIEGAKQGVKLNYIEKPRIKIVHNIARQTINNYRRKLKIKGSPAFHHIDYSYSEDNFKPLGLELFKQKIAPQKSTLEFLLSDMPSPVASGNFADPNISTKDTYYIDEGESNPHSWDFDICNIVLGNFNYKKMSLVSDYNKIVEQEIEHPVFNELFSNEPRKAEAPPVENNPVEWNHVITADPTQARAILHSRSGKSYIIQGPPGTGKSQTITNLIADFLANDKSILFVCEKRAALDVVYHRLQQNQLSELCCYIHDSQGDKKDFIKDLRMIYEDFLKSKMDISAIEASRMAELDHLMEMINFLQGYHEQQRKIEPEAGVSTRKLVEVLVNLKKHAPKISKVKNKMVPTYNLWVQFGQVIEQLGSALEESGADAQFSEHPFSNLGVNLINSEHPLNLMESLVEHAFNSIQQISAVISKNNIPAQHSDDLVKIKNLILDSAVMESLALSENLALVQAANAEAKEFEAEFAKLRQLQEAYEQTLATNKRWLTKLEPQELEQAIETAQKHERSFLNFLNGEWKRLKKAIKGSYDFSSHQVKPQVSAVLMNLKNEYQAQADKDAFKKDLEKRYRVENVDMIYTSIEVLRRKKGDQEMDFLLSHPQANALVIELSRLNNTLHKLEEQLQQCLYEINDKSLSQLNDELATIQSNADNLKLLLPALRKFANLPAAVQKAIRVLPLSPIQAEAAMANKTYQGLYEKNQSFAIINQRILQEKVKEIEQSYKKLLRLNSDYIRAKRRQKFQQHYELSNTAASVLTPEQKLLKKAYVDGRKILEHEMSKTMRYKSIRELASNASGRVLKDIKPVWLMSPLSVSDSLPLDAGFFDVVIFDEASQITLEEGIPALFRGPQSIIVGDDKQMPPSNFFNAAASDPEDLELIDGEMEDEILTSEADSLLVQGSRKLASTMLSWHYRSRYEALISYSNHAFYQASLLTIPDKATHQGDQQLLEISQAEEGFHTAATLLDRSISFHYLPNSIYEARSNINEAKYIAQMVKRLLLDNVQESIGIVAFSQEQQGIIEEAVDNLAATDKSFEELLEKAYNRKDDGQFTGLFIKNLENVQGDERDIIILSICYGHDSNKKMLMNFGPVNKKGGEKRLNVIFSRARKHMAVVSSIRHHHITNDYNDGANYFKRFLQYAEMISTGNMPMARVILDTLIAGEGKKSNITYDLKDTSAQIKSALESRGYYVEENVGQSSFKCSLAIKKNRNDAQYCLGILIDNEHHYNNDDLVEQYYQRPAILEAFGWRVTTVFAKDWLDDSEHVLNYLIKHIDEDAKPGPIKHIPPPAEKEMAGPVFTQLIAADGQKFWKVAQNALQLQIVQGKLGSNGQSQIRSFSSEEELLLAKDQMINEKLEAGYTMDNI